MIRAVLLDVEGTTTSIRFVTDVLFPYAREHARAYLTAHGTEADVEAIIRLINNESERDRTQDSSPPTGLDAVLADITWLMDRDRKTSGLKRLQGRIWRDGYLEGKLRGHVYDDVPGAFERMGGAGLPVAIFSSGSVEAQKLLFSFSIRGDLTPHLAAHFDTTIGSKLEPVSYRAIATALGRAPGEVLFVTDHLGEARAAAEAGLEAWLSVRPENPPVGEHAFRTVTTLAPLGELAG